MLLNESWYWFPITYVYSGGIYYNSYLIDFAVKMKSQYEIKKYYQLFGTNDDEEIIKMFEKMSEFTKNRQDRYRFSNCFDCAEVFLDFIKLDEIGQYK